MAITNDPYLKNYKGHLKKTYLVKQAPETILTSYPDRSRVIYRAAQKSRQASFAEAVVYARSIIRSYVRRR